MSPSRFVSFPICTLPAELLLLIGACLDCSALCSLRLTCKTVYDCTFPLFRKYLENLTTDLSLTSLQKLDSLSRNQELCSLVQTLSIDGTEEDIIGSGLTWEHHRSGLLVIPQESIQRWQGVLLRLVNCQSFHLHKWNTPDGPDPFDKTTPDDTITVLLSILIAIERPIRELSILFKRPGFYSLDHLDLSRVHNGLLHDPKFITTCCSTLEALTFKFEVEEEGEVNFVVHFIHHAKNRLERLTIDFCFGECAAPLMFQMSLTTRPPLRLQELHLMCGNVDSDQDLIRLLFSSKRTLVKIHLGSFTLGSGAWAAIFRTLSEFSSLTDISVRHLMGYTTQRQYGRIHFPALLRDPIVDPVQGTKFSYTVTGRPEKLTVVGVQYSGRSMDIALQKLAEYATFLQGRDSD
ncbi:uncharacterized protein BO88DRAFT_346991 [Aspergillus vadensis CBS 113365]|uniref:F-box domain-containing protein n=1 Tax=Aspergillus vadensis (strain CBS 113365 / IMI 142717 / IBT 24658) TaxID=1448311 RepID=A0A319CCH4_ASPVC|nr:hypothetical protein BO88DRAFT_346991 [Aspergillus vadensis CBS 113365]PYH66122.1 hypothetical protein BO88DRAFT_346991 [Aspergillus vadensis CBS 113365]